MGVGMGLGIVFDGAKSRNADRPAAVAQREPVSSSWIGCDDRSGLGKFAD
jgi:hypothetical protein